MKEKFNYDVFLSYNAKDKPVARELAKRLKRDGLRVWFDEWEMEGGDSIFLKIEEGLEQSRTLVLLMSANAIVSEWVTLEHHTVMFRNPTNSKRRFIPVRLDETEIKGLLSQFHFIDWRQKSTKQYAKLLAACRPPAAPIDFSVTRKGKKQQIKILEGHTSGVNGVAVTADGRRAISASHDKTARVWDIEKCKCIAILKGHTSHVYGVAVTADGRRAVSGSYDKTVRVWDVEKCKCIATLEGHTYGVNQVAVTADGWRAVSASDDYTVRVWDIEKGECIATLEGHISLVNGVAMTADGRRAISASHDKTVRVWDIEKCKCIAILKGHTSLVYGVAVTADGRRAVSASHDKTVRVWDVEKGKCIATLEGHTAEVLKVAMTADGRRAVSGSADKTVRVWDIERTRFIATLEGHTDWMRGVAVTADGRRAVSGSADKTVRVWELSPYVDDVYTIASEAAQIYRQYTNSDQGLDGEIEFKDYKGNASGQRVYLQLKMGDSYLRRRRKDGAEIFLIKNKQWATYWQQQAYPVMLVIRTSDGEIRWMNVTEYLKQHSAGGKRVKQIVFSGEPLTASSLLKMRDALISIRNKKQRH